MKLYRIVVKDVLRWKGRVLYGLISLLVMASLAGLASCNSGNPGIPSSGLVSPTWLKAEVTGDAAAISLADVQKNKMTHFVVGIAAGDLAFMTYELGGKIYTRASICPPCRSQSFSLRQGTLVCDTCGTTFDAKTGDGVGGACVAYPKAAVTYEVNGGKIVMTANNLITAYQDTLKPGKP